MRVRLLIAAVVITACGGSDSSLTPPSGNATKTVDIFTVADAFSPTFATLNPGDTARWNFAVGSGNMGHNVRFTPRITGSPSDIAVMKSGTATRVFTTRGTFTYVCDVHPGMQAQVTVE